MGYGWGGVGLGSAAPPAALHCWNTTEPVVVVPRCVCAVRGIFHKNGCRVAAENNQGTWERLVRAVAVAAGPETPGWPPPVYPGGGCCMGPGHAGAGPVITGLA